MVPSGLGGGIEAARRISPWAIRQAEALGSWIRSWSGGSDIPDVAIAKAFPATGAPRPELGGQAGSTGMLGDAPAEEDAWLRITTWPPFVVVSVAAVAHLCWHSGRWRKSRGGSRAASSNRRRVRLDRDQSRA